MCMKSQLFLSGLLILSLSACSRKENIKLPVEREKFVNAYADVAALDNQFQPGTPQRDSLFAARVDSVLHADGLTREQFQKTINVLNASPQAWEPILKDVLRKLQEKQTAAKGN